MTDRDWLYTGGITLALVILWWVASHRIAPGTAPSEAIGALPVGWDQPMQAVYAANPEAYLPPSNYDLTVQVGNQLPSILSDKYTPLFGFVGIAQGALFQ